MIAAVLPMGPKDAAWLSAKANSCKETLSAHMVAAVLVFAPGAHLAALRNTSSGLPTHWHLLAEEEVVPKAVGRGVSWRVPWMRQQMIKLLAPGHHAAWPATARYVLTLDSDTLCTHGWQGAGEHGTMRGASNTSALLETFVQSDGRIRGCVQPTQGWFGSVQLKRTGRFWGGPLDKLSRSMAHAMGWTPQILSVDALVEVQRALLGLPAPSSES